MVCMMPMLKCDYQQVDFLADLALDMYVCTCTYNYHVNNTGAWLVVNAHHLFQIDGIFNVHGGGLPQSSPSNMNLHRGRRSGRGSSQEDDPKQDCTLHQIHATCCLLCLHTCPPEESSWGITGQLHERKR